MGGSALCLPKVGGGGERHPVSHCQGSRTPGKKNWQSSGSLCPMQGETSLRRAACGRGCTRVHLSSFLSHPVFLFSLLLPPFFNLFFRFGPICHFLCVTLYLFDFFHIFSPSFSLCPSLPLSNHPSILSCIIYERWRERRTLSWPLHETDRLQYHCPPPGITVHQQMFPSCIGSVSVLHRTSYCSVFKAWSLALIWTHSLTEPFCKWD